MKVLVCGGRDFTDFTLLCNVLNGIFADVDDIDLVITGAANGADTLAKRWAEHHEIAVKSFPADWTQHGFAAGPIRNKQMLIEGEPDLVVAFPGGPGTADMVRQARKADVRVIEVPRR